jgi:Flp pilus assembly pilin Flp
MSEEDVMRQRPNFWNDDEGQDLIEYTLLMTFIVLAVFAFIGTGRPMVNAIWTTANSDMVTANSMANAS